MTKNEKILLIVLGIIALTIVGYNSFVQSKNTIKKVAVTVDRTDTETDESVTENSYISETDEMLMLWERMEGIDDDMEPDVIMIESGKEIEARLGETSNSSSEPSTEVDSSAEEVSQ